MNFRIIEGDNVLSQEEYDSFRRDYLHSDLLYLELGEKYGLSKKQYSDLISVICAEEGILRRNVSKPKYYRKQDGKWYVQKSVKNKTIVLGSFKCSEVSEETVKKVVEECKLLNWDYNLCQELFKVGT